MAATRAQYEEFMGLIADGSSVSAAARAVGVSRDMGSRWKRGYVPRRLGGHGTYYAQTGTDFEMSEREAQAARASELARKGLPVLVVAERIASMGPRVDEKTVRRWMAEAGDEG